MYLKRIEIEGFKSFADRTVIPVERGLTGIVGPNGCGKSNVVDALLWVMGERSAKALRADAMDDVIFSGTEGRPAGNYAMVEVIMGDPEGKIVEAGGEVGVARRLFRSGEAEYLLNGRKVRRKDVKDVLMDTGLGVRGYMVLAQGKIDAVLAANPAERRSVFEEAAGISRYKARKHEAQLKLKKVDLDLERVDDVLSEVSRAVRSLKLQAGKAKRFLELRDRYRELRVRMAFADEQAFTTESRALAVRDAELERELEALRDAREAGAARLAELEKEETALRSRHDGLRAEAGEVKERAAGLEERVSGLETRASEGEARIGRDRERLAALEQELEAAPGADANAARQVEALQAALAEARAAEAEVQASYDAARARRDEVREAIEKLRRSVLDALADRTQANNAVAAAAKLRSEAEGSLAATTRREEDLRGEVQGASAGLVELQRARAEADSAAEAAALAADQAAIEVERLQAEHEGYAATAHDARQRMAAAVARLEALQLVDDEMPGAPDHVRELHESGTAGVHGWVLDGIHVEAPWDRMLENLLGRMQHALWLDQEAALDGLPEGSFDFFHPVARDGVPTAIDGARPLRALLQGDAARADALCNRLGAVYWVETDGEARSLARRHPEALFLARDGSVHGGGYARTGVLGDNATGMLARRNDREEARHAVQLAEAEAERAETHEQETNTALRAARAARDSAERRGRETAGAAEEAASRLSAAEKRAAGVEAELASLLQSRTELGEAVAAASAAEERAATARDAAEEHRLVANATLEEQQSALVELEASYDAAAHTLQEKRVLCSRAEQELDHFREQLDERAELVARQRAESGKLAAEIAQLGERCAELRGEAEQARAERSTLLERRAGLEERVAEAATQLERAALAVHQERTAQGGGEGRLEELLGRRQEAALEIQRVRLQQDELVRGVVEEFGQPLEELARSLNVDASAPIPEGVDEEALRSELGGLRRSIESIGSVNLDAVEELEERQQREEFLIRERDDLLAAKANLEATLEDLDQQCRERFVATFESVQGTFEQIFRRLFRGGRAELRLGEGEDPLTAGIEITARPPGKELRSINLLSGGERTLTALALLLAVFRSRPSPFCLLDEVDAALDDANVERFVDALQDFVGTTQFLVVTHNRITMARCERLFGVTMRKRGVSMVVSVELSQVQAADGDVRIGEAPEAARRAPLPAVERRGTGESPPPAERELEAGERP